MFRAIPVSNKICFDKEVKRSWKIHEDKLENLKATVGKEQPEKYQFLDQRPKKIALKQVRNMQIDRENKALLKKIKQIQSKGCKTSYKKLYQDLSEYKKKTLNQPYRKKQLIKIVEENQEILKRLQLKKSAYSIKKMEKERKQIEKNISLISQYPFKNYPASHTPVNLWATEQNFYSNQKTNQSRALEFTFKGQKNLDGANYLIITYLSKGTFYMEIQSMENKADKYRIELPQQKAKDLLEISYGGSISQMIDNLSIEKEKKLCYLKYASRDSLSH